jgi:sterol desaturase/sphingolipid hydroxylase (fatty acid hydroxylase superfamily)
MQELIQYFATISDDARGIILVSGLTFFLLLEAWNPLFKFNYGKTNHAFLNIFFNVTTMIINLLGAILIYNAAIFNSSNSSGMLNTFTMPLWLYIMLGLLLMDLIGSWLIHYIQHKVKWMWKFHLIHHTDPYVDVTSGLRHHPGESVFRLIFTTLAVLITGVPFGIVMLYQTLSVFFGHMTHANIQMPKKINKILGLVFITPHFHKIHHHYVLPYTDSNYGNIFSCWDHLFSTSRRIDNLEDIVYGIDTHMKKYENSNLKNLLLIPIQTYRPPLGSKFGG